MSSHLKRHRPREVERLDIEDPNVLITLEFGEPWWEPRPSDEALEAIWREHRTELLEKFAEADPGHVPWAEERWPGGTDATDVATPVH